MTLQYASDILKEKAKVRLRQFALLRTESAIVIAGTLILSVLTGLGLLGEPLSNYWWLVTLAGLAGEGALFYSTMQDREVLRKIMDQLFREQFDLKKIKNASLKQKLEKAFEYRHLIMEEIEREDNFVLDDHLLGVASELEDWIKQVYHLAENIDLYLRDPIMVRDMNQVPRELEELEKQLRHEKAGRVRSDIERSIATKKKQYETLTNLQETMSRAMLQLDNTLSAIGTIYMQARHLGAKEIDSGRSQRLQADMHEQILTLEDITSAMDDVFQNNDPLLM